VLRRSTGAAASESPVDTEVLWMVGDGPATEGAYGRRWHCGGGTMVMHR
jgi:hypothetical protein